MASTLGTSHGVFMIIASLAILMVSLLATVKSIVGWRRATTDSGGPIGPQRVEESTAYRRYLAAASWSGGSRRDWEFRVWPVLRSLIDTALPDSPVGEIGEALWNRVACDDPRDYANHSQRGPDPSDLATVLSRLEAHSRFRVGGHRGAANTRIPVRIELDETS